MLALYVLVFLIMAILSAANGDSSLLFSILKFIGYFLLCFGMLYIIVNYTELFIIIIICMVLGVIIHNSDINNY